MSEKGNNDLLIDKLAHLELQERSLKRNINTYYFHAQKKEELFIRWKETKKEIETIKFKLRLERELKKNENSDTNTTKN